MTHVDRSRLPNLGADPAFAFLQIARHRGNNGLDIRTVEHHTIPVITFVLHVEAGAGCDPLSRQGLAALTADMLDEGTGALSAIDISDALARIGAEFDIDVGPDVATLTLTTLARFAERGAALLADLVVRPAMRNEDFERVRQLRIDRLRQLRDLPAATGERAFLRLLYGDHPYGHLSIGTDEALRAITLDEVRQFHSTCFRPGSATLVIAGDRSHEQMRALSEQAFGSWTGSTAQAPQQEPAAAQTAPSRPLARLALVPRERAAQSHLRIGHLAARRDSPDHAALLVMNAVLGGQFVSRINLKLREEKGYTYGARTGFDWRRGIGPFSLETSVDVAATADAVRDSLHELSAIRGEHPVTAQELALAKATLTRGYPRNFETAQQVARSISQLALYNLPDTYFETFVPTVNQISTDDVLRVASSYLDPSRLATLIVGDRLAIGDSLEDLQLGELVILSPEGF